MPLCTYAHHDGQCTAVDNAFIQHYMPYADADAVKVYLYGLMLCADPLCAENTLQGISVGLDMPPAKVEQAFTYWQEMGLVRVASKNPLTVLYLSPAKALAPTRLIPKDKYHDFIIQLQEFFPDREMSTNELYTYLQFLEETHMEPQALLMIAKFCVDRKGTEIRTAYILTVARNWYLQGCTTLSDAEIRIREADNVSEELRAVFHALHKTAQPDIDDRQRYTKWTGSWGFAPAAIVRAAKTVKRGGMDRLDEVLDGFFRAGVFTVEDINSYIKQREAIYSLCVRVNKILGLYYESLDYLVETYTNPWRQIGYSEKSLEQLAKYCAMRGIRTIEGMDEVVRACYRQGVVEEQSVAVYLDDFAKVESALRRIIETTGSTRRPTENDRDLYRTWRSTWGFEDEVILYAAGLSAGKPYAMANVGNLLSRWHAAGAHTMGAVREIAADVTPPSGAKAKKSAVSSNYIAPVAGDEFRRAEVRAALMQDAEYRKLDQRVRTLNMQVAHCQLEDKDVPLTLEQDLHDAEIARDARIRALGYDPADAH